jgi:hypothetical protein
LLRKTRCDTAAWHYFLAAIDLARSQDVVEAAKAGMREIEGCKDSDER